MTETDSTRLTISWSKNTDLALRAFLGAQGMKKGALSKFVEEAVCDRLAQGCRESTEKMEHARFIAAMRESEVAAANGQMEAVAPAFDRIRHDLGL